jgi:hypothetical protein
MHHTKLAVSALALCLSAPTWAATLVESNAMDGQQQQVWLDGQKVRIDGGDGNYMLMNLADKKMFAVNSAQKQAIELSDRPSVPDMPPGMTPPEAGSPVAVKWVEKDPGPKIAGYATKHYEVTANGEFCSDEYLAADVLKISDIKSFIKAMQEMNPKKNTPMPFMQANPCLQAGIEMAEQFETLGMSMRSVGKDGKVQHEITNIQTGVDAPAGAFELPQDYQVNTPQQMMQRMMEQMSERMKNMPPEERQRMMEMQQRMMPAPPK